MPIRFEYGKDRADVHVLGPRLGIKQLAELLSDGFGREDIFRVWSIDAGLGFEGGGDVGMFGAGLAYNA
jgi:hypothetical protein